MKYKFTEIPRVFTVGSNDHISISDFGQIHLDPNEQVTFIMDDEFEYDVARKDWGFYATPSLNGRLKSQGFKSALVKNSKAQFYIMLVHSSKLKSFDDYCKNESQVVVQWLDELNS